MIKRAPPVSFGPGGLAIMDFSEIDNTDLQTVRKRSTSLFYLAFVIFFEVEKRGIYVLSIKRTVYSCDRAKVVDEDGVIVDTDQYDRIILERKQDSPKPIYFNKGVEFVKLYENIIPKLIQELTPSEVTFMLALSPLVSYVDCVIRRTSNKNSDVATSKEIAMALNMDESKVRRLLSSLKKKGVIGKCSTGSILPEYYGKKKNVYLVNPYIYFKGVSISPFALEVFNNSGWKELLS